MPKQEVKPKLGELNDKGEPKLGMKFENSRSKLLKYKSSRQNPYLKESLIGQVEKHEGTDAANDLRKEINFKYDEENKKKSMDFINNPKGKLTSTGIDFGSPKTYAWCDTCNERSYIYSVISCEDNKSIYRCNRCGTNCLELTKEELKVKEESYGKKR